MEEDTGKSLHVGGATGRIHGADFSLVDYNRAGIPLIEIVTKPLTGAGERAPEIAKAYVGALRELQAGQVKFEVTPQLKQGGQEGQHAREHVIEPAVDQARFAELVAAQCVDQP